MADQKTQPTDEDPAAFIAAVEHPTRRADAELLLELMARVTGEPAVMWGPTIVGFGAYHYRYDSGHEGDAAKVAFSPRKANIALYGLANAPEAEALLARLGKHKRGAGCVYVNKLADVELGVLEELVAVGYGADLVRALRVAGGAARTASSARADPVFISTRGAKPRARTVDHLVCVVPGWAATADSRGVFSLQST